ncbi:hypothetical protein AGMMS49546_28190 [Spirochaetia bacterium]|nr:hypothetical protein AGMMS49546_28190 [Spirochaetia bacterium]
MKKNKDGFVEFPATQVIGNQKNSAQAEVKADSEKSREILVNLKKQADKLSADVIMMGEKIILSLRLWLCFFLKFPTGTDVVSIDEDNIYCVRKMVSGRDQFYLVIDSLFARHIGYPYDSALKIFIARLLMSDVCTFKGKSKMDYYECFSTPDELCGFSDEEPMNSKEFLYDCLSNFIDQVSLDFFIINGDEISEEANTNFSATGSGIIRSLQTYFARVARSNRSIDFIIDTILEELPLGSAERLLLEDLLNNILEQRKWSQQKSITPKDDIMDMLLLAEALKADADTPEMMLPRKTDWIFPWTRVDEDGFPLNGSFYPSKK